MRDEDSCLFFQRMVLSPKVAEINGKIFIKLKCNLRSSMEGLGQEEKGMTEDEMVGWHHQLDGHEFEQALGVGDGQGSLACCSP